jgi:hypothetical protein
VAGSAKPGTIAAASGTTSRIRPGLFPICRWRQLSGARWAFIEPIPEALIPNFQGQFPRLISKADFEG